MSTHVKEEGAASSEGSFHDSDVVKKQIVSAWMAEITMKTKSVICPLTADLTKPLRPGTLPFYCVHSIAGGGGAELRHLATFLTSEQPLLAIQMPMDRRNKENVKSVYLVAEYYCQEVLAFHHAHYGEMPFALGGWSAGATIALEMAQRLASLGQMPALLIAIDKAPRNTKAEIDPIRNSLFDNVYLWVRLQWRKSSSFRDLGERILQKTSWCVKNKKMYGSDTSEADKRNHLNKLKSRTPEEQEFIETLWDELENYQPSLYEGKVVVLMTREGCIDRVAEGWKAIARHPKIVEVPGTHASIISGVVMNGVADLRDVRSLAEVLRRELLDDLQQPKHTQPRLPTGPTALVASLAQLVWTLRGARRGSATGLTSGVSAPSAVVTNGCDLHLSSGSP